MMGLPGFTATESIYQANSHYRLAITSLASTMSRGGSPQGEPSRRNIPGFTPEYIVPWFERAYWPRAGQLGWGCDGYCAIIQCTPASPCTSDLITYTTGNRCASEGSTCGYGCTCRTTIDWWAFEPKCTCS